jgi:putative hydrolase of the HAD superfamily
VAIARDAWAAMANSITAVLWDFGGVISESPFDAFARYESEHGLPVGFLRRLNATNPDDNAWARLERNEVSLSQFAEIYAEEAARAGHAVDGRAVLGLLGGRLRPEMVEALRRCRGRFTLGLLTNNFVMAEGPEPNRTSRPPPEPDEPDERTREMAEVLALFDVVLESRQLGVRKPDPRFYRLACERVGIRPEQAVFLDDLGINLKPARQMGMATIKVTDPFVALDELSAVLGVPMR